MVSQRQEPQAPEVDLQPLITALSSYTPLSHEQRKNLSLQTNAHAHLMPCIAQLIERKGFKVFQFQEAVDYLLSRGNIEGLIIALQLASTRGVSAGLTAHSSQPEVCGHFVAFDFDQFAPDQQLLIMVHELGHVMTPATQLTSDLYRDLPQAEDLLALDPQALQRPLLQAMETIAYGTQFGVMQALGLDCLTQTMHGMRKYGITPELVHKHAPIIQANVAEILQWIAEQN